MCADIESMRPEDAVEQYVQSRKLDSVQSTVQNVRYRLKQFRVWADENGLDDTNAMSGRKAEQFKIWRVTECGINAVTLQQHLRTFRQFLRWCEANDAVEPGVADKVIIPQVDDEEKASDDYLGPEQTEEILDYLTKYEYSSLRHVIFHTLWHTGMRTSSLRALNLGD